MKASDIVGFAAILTAGYYAGSQSATGQFWSSWTNMLIVFALLAIGFYFAVVLS
jgi:hypothetical protein